MKDIVLKALINDWMDIYLSYAYQPTESEKMNTKRCLEWVLDEYDDKYLCQKLDLNDPHEVLLYFFIY